MRVLVLSDSHGNERNLISAAERSAPDHVVFLGDGMSDAEALARRFPALPLVRVRGNCDFASDAPNERLLTLGGVRLLVCHGHTLRVKYGLLTAVYAARERGADAVLFGHTHEPLIDTAEGVLLFNPGSIGSPYRPTYGVLTLEGGDCVPAICNLKEELP